MKIRSLISLATIVLAACTNAGPQATGTYQTTISQARLFRAASDATTEIGYRVTSSSQTDGTIYAEQNNVILGHGSASGMSARITTNPGGTRTLRVRFFAPPGTFSMGDFSQNVTEYIAIVRTQVPDLRASQ